MRHETLWCGVMKGLGEGRSELVHTVWKQQPFSAFQKHVFPSPGILLWHISLLWGRSISVCEECVFTSEDRLQ